MDQLVGILVKVLLFAFVAGIFAVVFVVSRRGRKERERITADYADLARIAPERGWSYAPRVRGEIDQYCGAPPFPGSGSNLSAWHYTTGEFRGRAFKYFEYRYNNPMSGGEAAARRNLIIESVFIMATPGTAPAVEIFRPDMLDSVMDRRTRVQLGVSEFDERFRIASQDEGFARSVLSGDLVPFLLSDPRAETSRIALRGDKVFTWYSGTLSPAAAEEKLGYLCDVLDRIPAHVWTSA
ncbi:hypothetical protein [Streptomyces sp. VRA16 Mangrove soil]|uniref:hypothetical protein n=1 Tax=Streptomyces sp. VRA16 Mangrove soil TaxID=2817434 RepID=UPI001A9E20AF|nr:hypothetical protein [Streptomyces sp. VRA16 Mangrove soil]MBO1336039.1 hypothetical protein [Streptomyces sp. VRA16 Mangrove soil]